MSKTVSTTSILLNRGQRGRQKVAKSPSKLNRFIIRSLVIVGVLAVWHVFSLTDMGRSGDVPSPIAAITKLVELLATSGYWSALGVTMQSWGLGLLLSLVIGVPLGLLVGSLARLELSTRLLIDFLRTIPSIAFLPLVLLIFGVDIETPVLLILYAAVWPMLIQASYAASEIDPVLRQVRRAFHLSWAEYIRFQFVPSAMPFITTGLRIAANICLLTAISVEFLSGAPGVGAKLQEALVVNQSITLYAYVITAGVLGVLVNYLLLVLQRALIWWHPSIRGDAR